MRLKLLYKLNNLQGTREPKKTIGFLVFCKVEKCRKNIVIK